MRVNSVSLVLNFALKNAGMPAQSAPVTTEAITMQAMSAPFDIVSPSSTMQAAAAIAPASTCPSAPRFQQCILNAGVTAREIMSKIAVS